MVDGDLHLRPEEILKDLIRFETVNPPGNEAECILWIRDILESAGLTGSIISVDEKRPNLIVRLKGRGEAPPFLMYGHADVVTTAGQNWKHPPFEGVIEDGWIWGRGALDMKGGLAMMIAAMLRARAEGKVPAGDIILAVVSDEENGGDFGAKFLVREHADLFEGVRYAIGEFGGFSMKVGSRRAYPVAISEKQICWMKAVVRGPGGHGSQIMRGGAMSRLARMLTVLDQTPLPVHITTATRLSVEGLADAVGFPKGMLLKQLLNPKRTDKVLKLMGDQASTFEPMLRNTVNATVVRGGEKTNVIPSEIELELDGRLLPGFKPMDMLRELKDILAPDISLEVLSFDPGPDDPDMGLFDTLASVITESDPDGRVVPLLMTGVSDARFFSQIGIQTYGFLPMKLPDDFDFISCIHAADERIPLDAVRFGADAMYRLISEHYTG